jgi:hypothetical protein
MIIPKKEKKYSDEKIITGRSVCFMHLLVSAFETTSPNG